jgi:hypothetical protein
MHWRACGIRQDVCCCGYSEICCGCVCCDKTQKSRREAYQDERDKDIKFTDARKYTCRHLVEDSGLCFLAVVYFPITLCECYSVCKENGQEEYYIAEIARCRENELKRKVLARNTRNADRNSARIVKTTRMERGESGDK